MAAPFTITISPKLHNQLPEKGAIFGAFEVLDITPASGGKQGEKVKLQLICYDTGTFRLWDLMPNLVADTSIIITVAAPANNAIQDYGQPREINHLVEKKPSNTPWLILAALAVVLALVLVYLYNRRKISGPLPPVMVGEHSMDILYRVESKWGRQEISSRELGESLVQALHLHFKVPSKKSIGALYKTIRGQVGDKNTGKVKTCLRLCDAWRFGKQIADRQTGAQTIDTIKNLLEEKSGGIIDHKHV